VIDSYSALKKVSFVIPDLTRDPADLQRFPFGFRVSSLLPGMTLDKIQFLFS